MKNQKEIFCVPQTFETYVFVNSAGKTHCRKYKSIKRLFLIGVFFSLIVITQSTQAATLNVPSTQYPTIQSAVNAANGGDTIILQAGTTFTEEVTLKYKSGSDYITIQSSALSNLPPDGQRVNPSYAQYMPKIAPPGGGGAAIVTEITASGPSHHYKLLGIEVKQPNVNVVYALVYLGSGDADQNSLTKVAHHFIIDRCYIHGHPDGELRRGIALNTSYTNIVNSYISDAHQVGTDAQAISGWNGPGPYVINNNYLEGAAENVLFGGTDPKIQNLVPSDIEMRYNYFYKPPAWRTRVPAWQVKNSFELKNARRVLIEGNIFDTVWDGTSILFTVRNQEGTAPWSTIEDVEFKNNIIRNTPLGFRILGQDDINSSQNMKNIVIGNNLCVTDANTWGYYGNFILIANAVDNVGIQNFTIDHNTFISFSAGAQLIAAESSSKVTGLYVKNNIGTLLGSNDNSHVLRDGVAGTVALNNLAGSSWSFLKNILTFNLSYDYWVSSYPLNNFYVHNISEIGFQNLQNGSYQLSQSSPYRNQGTDGKDIGADFNALNAATCGVTTGVLCGTPLTQTPYPGPMTPNAPTTIEVENFDNGGEGVAYHETFGNTGSAAYRAGQAVDIQNRPNAASNNYVVFEAAAGEWLEYTINVPFTRKFDIGVRYASEFNNGTFHIEDCGSNPQNQTCAGTNLTGTMTANSTGYWGNFRVVTARNVQLTAGTHVLRLKLDTNAVDGNNQPTVVVGNFDAILFKPTLFDYDNDGRADVSLFRPSDGNWYLDRSSAGFAAVAFGASTDIIAPADFDGDGKTDVSVFRPSNGTWYRLNSSNNVLVSTAYGASGDVPVQADYDNDGKADVAIFRPSNGTWYYIKSSDASSSGGQFGQLGDKPAVGDYDGDGKADLAIFRPSTGYWYIQNSSNSTLSSISFGASTDVITPADYDGDGKTDVAVFRPSNGTWYIQKSQLGFAGVQFGQSGDIPIPADYDGDGKVDIAVFRPSTGGWYISKSTEGYTSQIFGQSGDIPTPSIYVR